MAFSAEQARKARNKNKSRAVKAATTRPIPLGLGKYLRDLREAKDMTMKDVAHALKLGNYQLIYNLEHEKCLPPLAHVKKLSIAYGVPDKDIRLAIVKHVISKVKRKYGFKP